MLPEYARCRQRAMRMAAIAIDMPFSMLMPRYILHARPSATRYIRAIYATGAAQMLGRCATHATRYTKALIGGTPAAGMRPGAPAISRGRLRRDAG